MITDPVFYLRKNPNRFFTSNELSSIMLRSRSNVNKKLKEGRKQGKITRKRIDSCGYKFFVHQWNPDYRIKGELICGKN